MNDVIEVKDLQRRYGDHEAVAGVSFSVRQGELFALLGTNGAGKTSTLEVLEGIARPSGGMARILGLDPYADRPAVRPRIGIMLQEGGFPSDLTVTEMGDMWAGMMAEHRPVGEALEIVDLTHRADVKIRSLSGGERRRLDLALAVLGRPEVLFLDEPTTGLDPQSRRNTWQLVRDLLSGGTTVLLTTHYLEEAEALADRIAIMHEGRIVTSGTAADIAAAHPARISFELSDASLRAEVADMFARTDVDGPRVVVQSDDVQRALTDLLMWADPRGIELAGIDVRSGSLEQAFMSIASSGRTEEVTA